MTTYSSSNHNAFELSKKLVVACYALCSKLPPEEKTALSQYIRQASLSAHFSIAQGAFLKKSKARKKFTNEAKNSLVVIDAAMDVLVETGLARPGDTDEVMQLSSACYGLLQRLKKGK